MSTIKIIIIIVADPKKVLEFYNDILSHTLSKNRELCSAHMPGITK